MKKSNTTSYNRILTPTKKHPSALGLKLSGEVKSFTNIRTNKRQREYTDI